MSNSLRRRYADFPELNAELIIGHDGCWPEIKAMATDAVSPARKRWFGGAAAIRVAI